jgi:hypothetical protein
LEETTAGDPMSFLRWTSKPTRAIAEELARLGYPMTPTTVARCWHELEYSWQANIKTIEGRQHPDRDAQFRSINARVRVFERTVDPVVSVDTKKKELIGAFRNAGRAGRPAGAPPRVFTHDFPHLGIGKAIPYGNYDLTQDRAVVPRVPGGHGPPTADVFIRSGPRRVPLRVGFVISDFRRSWAAWTTGWLPPT